MPIICQMSDLGYEYDSRGSHLMDCRLQVTPSVSVNVCSCVRTLCPAVLIQPEHSDHVFSMPYFTPNPYSQKLHQQIYFAREEIP